MEKRICRKCMAVREIAEDFEDYLERYLDNMPEDEQVSDFGYEKRLGVCKTCALRTDSVCRACGCYVELRAAVAGQSCPYEKWGPEESRK